MTVEETYLPIDDGRPFDERGVAWFEKRGHTVMNGGHEFIRLVGEDGERPLLPIYLRVFPELPNASHA